MYASHRRVSCNWFAPKRKSERQTERKRESEREKGTSRFWTAVCFVSAHVYAVTCRVMAHKLQVILCWYFPHDSQADVVRPEQKNAETYVQSCKTVCVGLIISNNWPPRRSLISSFSVINRQMCARMCTCVCVCVQGETFAHSSSSIIINIVADHSRNKLYASHGSEFGWHAIWNKQNRYDANQFRRP